jgi:ABC-type antimicrobial peptide transport system permease subunit
MNKALAAIEPIFRKYDAGSPFDYKFVDQEYARKFANERRIGSLATVFAVLAIFISCLGLFGLANFSAERRGREIGVRKVLGASVFSIWRLLSREFFLLVTISCCIAGPISYYFMHEWLKHYTYRTDISWYIFAVTIAGALLITLLTVSIQALKAAVMKPAERLRTE